MARPGMLIALCWMVYASSYVAKLSYNANISPIGDAYGVSYREAGTVSTFFFFAYVSFPSVSSLPLICPTILLNDLSEWMSCLYYCSKEFYLFCYIF